MNGVIKRTIVAIAIAVAGTCVFSACGEREQVVPLQPSESAMTLGVQHLYVLNDGGPEGLNSVAIYVLGATKPSSVIKKGVYDPKALAIDALGQIYVANYFSNNVTVYAPGGRSPARYVLGMYFPNGISIDANRDFAVMSNSNVGVYGPNGALQLTIQKTAPTIHRMPSGSIPAVIFG